MTSIPTVAAPSILLTRDDILMGRDKQFPLTPELQANLGHLLANLNKFAVRYNKKLVVTSGYRPAGYNTAAGGAVHSNHMVCLACDFHDPDGAIDAFSEANLQVLADCGLYLEDPAHTPGWCHLQAVAPHSGNRIFIP